MPIAIQQNKSIVSFIIIFGALSFHIFAFIFSAARVGVGLRFADHPRSCRALLKSRNRRLSANRSWLYNAERAARRNLQTVQRLLQNTSLLNVRNDEPWRQAGYVPPPPYREARCTDSYVFILDNRPTTHGDALVVNTAELAFSDSIKLQIPVLV